MFEHLQGLYSFQYCRGSEEETDLAGVKSFKMGTVEDFTNFVNAVIDEKSFNSIKRYIDNAKKDQS